MISAILAAAAVAASPPYPSHQTLFFGIGGSSCATYRTTTFKEAEGGAWMLGFWSGLNHENEADHVVGISTDADGIIAEVRKACAESPSRQLMDVVKEVYVKVWLAEGGPAPTRPTR